MSACRDLDSTVAPAERADAPQRAPVAGKAPVPADSFLARAAAGPALARLALAPMSLGMDAAGASAEVAPAPLALLPAWDPTPGTSLDLGDDDCAAVPLGFGFTFYGREYTTVYPSGNGRVTLNRCDQAVAGSIPQDPAALVAPAAGDWNPAAGSADNVYYAVVGEAPHRRLVVTWRNVALYGSPSDARSTYQVQLLEGGNAVQIGYQAVAEVRPSLTAGVSSGRGPFVRSARYTELLALQGQALCYTPNGPDGYTVARSACVAPAVANRAPAATAGGPYAATEGALVLLDGSGSDADGDVLQYAWSFGDGSPSATGAQVAHRYADGGRYTATLTVTDPAGAAATSSAEVVVANAGPSARLTAPGWVEEGAPIALALVDATDPSFADVAAGLEYAFDCGDGYGPFGRAAAGACPTTDDGVRTVRAAVRDRDGATAEYEARVTVDNVAPRVGTPAAVTAASGEPVALSLRFSDPGARDMRWSYLADWGTGTAASGATDTQDAPIVATARYLRPGRYTATVTVTDKDGGAGRAAVQVTVLPLAVDVDVRPATLGRVERVVGTLPVVVLSSAAVDATGLVAETVRLGRTPPARRANGRWAASRQDVNHDGRDDLVLHFDRGTLIANGDLARTTREVHITGDLADGRQVAGSETVRTRP